jgi:hypothetical protein
MGSWCEKGGRGAAGTQIVTVQGPTGSPNPLSTNVRAVSDTRAIPVRLTRDATVAAGTFLHEEISEGIFDEINNVVDANHILAKGQQHFFLGQPVYYRVYAERQHVEAKADRIVLLLRSGVCDFYAPALFWLRCASDEVVARTVKDLYLSPRSPSIHFLVRLAALLGDEFYDWLYDRWNRKWSRYTQPPSFYFTFREMKPKLNKVDPRLLAAREAPTSRFQVEPNSTVTASALLDNPTLACSLLSRSCMRVFNGDSSMRTVARNLDYLAYGAEIRTRASSIAKATYMEIGNRAPGDMNVAESSEEQES